MTEELRSNAENNIKKTHTFTWILSQLLSLFGSFLFKCVVYNLIIRVLNWLYSVQRSTYFQSITIAYSVEPIKCTLFCFALFLVAILKVLTEFIWPIFPYNSGSRHWSWGNRVIAPGPAKQRWMSWTKFRRYLITRKHKQRFLTPGHQGWNKQRVLMHRHQGWNVRHGLCHIYMRYLYIYELFIAFVCFVVCSLL